MCCWASFFKSNFSLTACLLQAARSSILTGFVVQTCIEHFHPSSPSWNLSLYANFLEVNQDNGLLRNQPTAITWVRCFQFQSGLCFTNLFQAATFEKNPQSRAHVPIFAESFLLQNHLLTGNWLSCRLHWLHGPHFESKTITMDHRTIVKNQLWNQIQDVDPCLHTEEARGALHVSHLLLASPSCWLHFSIIFWSLEDDLPSMKKPCWMSMDSDLCSTQIPHPIHLSGESEGSTQMFSFNVRSQCNTFALSCSGRGVPGGWLPFWLLSQRDMRHEFPVGQVGSLDELWNASHCCWVWYFAGQIRAELECLAQIITGQVMLLV